MSWGWKKSCVFHSTTRKFCSMGQHYGLLYTQQILCHVVTTLFISHLAFWTYNVIKDDEYDSALKFRFKNGLRMSHFLPTFSILFDSCQFKALRAWLCVIDKNLGTWECLQQIWGQLICISSVYLSGFTAMIHDTRKMMSWIDLHILIMYKAL